MPQTQIRCPECGALNPLGNVLCDNCNSRLIEPEDVIPSDLFDEQEEDEARRREAAQVKGISLPTRSPGSENTGDESLPDWLRDLSPGAESHDETFDAPASPEVEDSSEAYPDWLSDLLEESGEPDEVFELDEDVRDEDAEAGELTLDANALPDWFSSAAALEDEEEAEIESFGDEASELPEWLAGLSETEETDLATATAPEAPDWLLADATEPASEEPIEAPDIPDWLLETATEAESAAPDRETVLFTDSDLPDWLADAQQLSEERAEGFTGPVREEAPSEAGAFPSEEAGFDEETTAEDAALAALLDAEATGEEDEAPELPDWLRASEAEREVEAEPETGEALPEWLTTLAEDDVSLDADEIVLPSPEAPTEEDSAPTAPAPLEPEPLGEAELPDWLSELDVEQQAAEEEETEPVAAFTDESAAPSDLAPGERPSWLEELTPEAEAEEQEPIPTFIGDELPDEEELSLPGSSEAPEAMPEWLRDLEPTTNQSSPTQVSLPETDDLARAELPSWLQELAPAEIALQAGATGSAGITDELVSAEIPDWVRALQPQPGQERTAATPMVPLPTPAEPEGPLEGLPGVLQPLATVDAPVGTHPAPEMPIPESVTAQAQLWQQLLEQPRMAERPVVQEHQRRKQHTTWVRLLVAAVLVLGLFAAFWVLPEGTGLFGTPSAATSAPGAQALMETLAALQPGDGIIVAIEYGNAYADEMTEIARPLLDHLDAQQATLSTVSTLPEGVVLGASVSSETRYLPGNASGIANFLARPENAVQDHLLILASSPERVRWWLEQVTLANQTRDVPLTVSVGLSASTGPRITPYLQTPAVQGWLVGLPDALAYRTLRGTEDAAEVGLGEYERVQEILVLAHWAAGAFLILGLFFNLVRRDPHGAERKGGAK